VLFCLDRAGVVGNDGPTHHGVFDLPLLRCLPGLTLMQPKDEAELAAMLATAMAQDGPCVIRYPREAAPGVAVPEAPAPLPLGVAEVIEEPGATPAGAVVWFWALGDMLPLAAAAAARLRAQGQAAGVVNGRFIKPLDRALLARQAPGARLFATLENGVIAGGFGSALQEALSESGFATPVRRFGWPDAFVAQGTSETLRAAHGLTPEAVAAACLSLCAGP
jgi:1-deoxy-D-xylulose-5-phosphate synthase